MGFREKLVNAPVAYTFESLFIEPGGPSVEPSEVSLETRFSRNVRIHIPISSSPMDTVTGWEMAVALALYGGIGVVHRNMSVEEQVEEVRRVKEHPPFARLRPLYATRGEPCERVLEAMRAHGVREVPVVDGGSVLGYVRLARLVSECRRGQPVEKFVEGGQVYRIDEVGEALRMLRSGRGDSYAIVSSGGVYLGTLTFHEALEEYSPALDQEGRLVVAAAVSPFDLERAKRLDKFVDALVFDVAHFHNVNVLRAAARIAKETSADIIVGNVGSYEAVVDALSHIERVDGVRAGVGGGSICTTPLVTGAYSPTLWAVASARDALRDNNVDVPVIADGGLRTPGDAVKALAVGAEAVMLGYALAGTDEACAPKLRIGDRLYKPYRGMASRGALEKRYAMDRYARIVKRVEEGIEGLVPYRGPVSHVIREWVEGIRAGLGYAGARSIRELWEKAKLIRVPSAHVISAASVKSEIAKGV